MIVVHPTDPSTRMLSLIYENVKDVTLFDSWKQRDKILKAIAAAPREEPEAWIIDSESIPLCVYTRTKEASREYASNLDIIKLSDLPMAAGVKTRDSQNIEESDNYISDAKIQKSK
jgi:hypothetical protein